MENKGNLLEKFPYGKEIIFLQEIGRQASSGPFGPNGLANFFPENYGIFYLFGAYSSLAIKNIRLLSFFINLKLPALNFIFE